MLIPIILIFILSSCVNKKNKLSDNTSTIAIDPTYVKVFAGGTAVAGGTVQLKAISRDSSGNEIDISPQWTVQPASLGSFGTPSTGKTVTFISGASPGTGQIYANYSNLRGVVNLNVSPLSYIIYNDQGFSKDIVSVQGNLLSVFPANALNIQPRSDGNGAPGDPISYLQLTDVTGGAAGFSVSFGSGRVMSLYSSLAFWIKGAVGGEQVVIGIDDGTTPQKQVSITNITTAWQKEIIPLSSFGGGGLMTLTIDEPFIFSFAVSTGQNASVYLDMIDYEK